MLAEDASLAGADLGGSDQDRHRATGAQGGEVDEFGQELAQRIDVERVELVGREQVGREAEREGGKAVMAQG
jgi:hypothetical protein